MLKYKEYISKMWCKRKKVQKSLISKNEPSEDTYITEQAERIIDMLFPKQSFKG